MQVFVYDPTASDELSKVRGVGRYVQILREVFTNEFTFVDTFASIPRESTLINPFFNILAPPLVRKRVAQKQVAVIHDLIPLKYPKHFPVGLKGKLNVFLHKLSLNNYDLFITDSEASKTDIVKFLGIPASKIHIAYPPIADVFFEIPKPIDSRQSTVDYFIYVGDATWNKNLVNLAKAVQLANVTCLFVGKVFSRTTDPSLDHPWKKELKKFLIVTQRDKRFVFPGYISDADLVNLYKNAVGNILVSRDEGFGFSYFEASSQSTPSILSDIPVLRETAADTGLFADPTNPTQIANRMQELLASPKLRKELGTNAKDRLKEFSREQFKKEVLKTISESK